MTKEQIADAALRAAGWKRVNEDALAAALVELEDVIHCCNQSHLKELPEPFQYELVSKLTKRLKK